MFPTLQLAYHSRQVFAFDSFRHLLRVTRQHHEHCLSPDHVEMQTPSTRLQTMHSSLSCLLLIICATRLRFNRRQTTHKQYTEVLLCCTARCASTTPLNHSVHNIVHRTRQLPAFTYYRLQRLVTQRQTFRLLWPWPWPDDLHIWIWHEDVEKHRHTKNQK